MRPNRLRLVRQKDEYMLDMSQFEHLVSFVETRLSPVSVVEWSELYSFEEEEEEEEVVVVVVEEEDEEE
jgi:hypothetical protein